MVRRFFTRKKPAAESADRIGPYRIERELGQGGMGVVYAARDERLGRSVAIKRITLQSRDPLARERLRREARAAATVNHPHICQIYEIGEWEGEPYIVMELLEGDPLADRLAGGPLPAGEAIEISCQLLSALAAVHARGIIHRDLKPANLILTPHGLKVLDFGLARPTESVGTEATSSLAALTRTGTLVGTPLFMAPEQVLGLELDARTDLFAAGAILFQMASGRPPFEGRSLDALFHEILNTPAPVLEGTPVLAAVGRIVRRALAKKRENRYQDAEAMKRDLEAIPRTEERSQAAPSIRGLRRLIVLPFHVLRPDPETDYLAFSLPDAVTTSLAGLEFLLVRSSITASRYAGDLPPLERLAAEADVDTVLSGTLLREGEEIRVNTQLSEVPSGTLLWSHGEKVSLRAIGELEGMLARRVLEILSVPVSDREKRILHRDTPKSPTAYEYFLRANQLTSYDVSAMRVAEDLYRRSVESDPGFAPAWCKLARVHWMLGKYVEDREANMARAEEALARAFDLNPDLPLGHSLAVQIDVSSGRAPEALRRLLVRARTVNPAPDLFAGLVTALRFGGMTEASLAAHQRARRIDPKITTSVTNTYWQLGCLEESLAEAGGDVINQAMVFWARGDNAEAIRRLAGADAGPDESQLRAWVLSFRAVIEKDRASAAEGLDRLVGRFADPEGQYYLAGFAAQLGDDERAFQALAASIDGCFHSPDFMMRDPLLAPLRAHPRFAEFHGRAAEGHRRALEIYRSEGGEELLGKS